LEVIYKLIEGLKKNYLQGRSDREKEKIADITVFVLCTFLAGLREEETKGIASGKSRDFLEGG